jgi:branched-chain amino acid transport system substrate-binding protein
MDRRGIKVVADLSTESGQTDFAADVVKAKAQCRGDLRLRQRRRKRALPARGAQAGRERSADRRDHAARPEGDRSSPATRERRARPCRPLGDIPVPAVAEFKNQFNARFKYVPITTASRAIPACNAIAHATKKLG